MEERRCLFKILPLINSRHLVQGLVALLPLETKQRKHRSFVEHVTVTQT